MRIEIIQNPLTELKRIMIAERKSLSRMEFFARDGIELLYFSVLFYVLLVRYEPPSEFETYPILVRALVFVILFISFRLIIDHYRKRERMF